MIMDGELDHIPEAAFNLKGTIEEAIEAGIEGFFPRNSPRESLTLLRGRYS